LENTGDQGSQERGGKYGRKDRLEILLESEKKKKNQDPCVGGGGGGVWGGGGGGEGIKTGGYTTGLTIREVTPEVKKKKKKIGRIFQSLELRGKTLKSPFLQMVGGRSNGQEGHE